eukprot:SAG22_NODE_7997_length_692_cov_1.721754_1_plen_81_part_01
MAMAAITTAASPRWYVLGKGAVGCLWASHLARSGTPVTLLVRRQAAPLPGAAVRVQIEDAHGGGAERWAQDVEVEEIGSGG